MTKKIFISYTLKGDLLNVTHLENLKKSLIGHCSLYVDILDNDSNDKQARVERELIESDILLLIKTKNIMESNWVRKEILLAIDNNIPIVDIEVDDLVEKFQPITMYIKHLADGANIEPVTFNKNCSGLTGLFSEMPNVSYT